MMMMTIMMKRIERHTRSRSMKYGTRKAPPPFWYAR